VEGAWFRYDEGQAWVLQDLCLQIPANQTVAFVGSTGSGKSTTADLILGLLAPQKGQVLCGWGSPGGRTATGLAAHSRPCAPEHFSQ
jgi:ABC-type bacteriocin/lantibiotic exporter with double-glycine peptidase domain